MMPTAQLIPLAHAGHWLWVLYVPPVAVVVFSIVKTTVSERRAMRKEREERKEPEDAKRQKPSP
jgi:cytochrome c-type biogenesis protein CcmH/NrfF